ncbi:autotransporter outer membrane beta-barrel domain-containing protein [Alicyclobacillus mengziensis]|uniref:PA14 domain-containing protein n=1 Tax=Alicyclobacillus mengziensis TaxID=2931921 RepID=A0A9X7Z9W5_9BACL|nr:hypothetical protein [Alicyclobacillus mengziensis]QSO50146.1 hypothetical protein JZ786_24580 [Alicyclobacillus mengziensis]
MRRRYKVTAIGLSSVAVLIGSLALANNNAYAYTVNNDLSEYGYVVQNVNTYTLMGGDTIKVSPTGYGPYPALADQSLQVGLEQAYVSDGKGNWGIMLSDMQGANANNGYLLVADPSTESSGNAQAWVKRFGGNWSYVQNYLQTQNQQIQTQDEYNHTQYNYVPFATIVSESGAIFVGNKQINGPLGTYTDPSSGNTYPEYSYTYPIETSNPPAATGLTVTDSNTGSSTITQGDPIQFGAASNVYLFSQLSGGAGGHHYDALEITNQATGQSYWAAGSGSSDISSMQSESGGTGAFNDALQYNSSSLQPGTYTASFWVGDEVDRISSTPATATFTVVAGAPGPGVSLTASPTSLTSGQASTLTANGYSVPSGDYIKIIDASGAGTLSGSNTYADLKTGESSLTTTATSSIAQTVTYEAELINQATGQVDASSSPVSVTWGAAAVESITVSANPTLLQSGQDSLVSYSTTNMQPGDKVMFVGVGIPTPFTTTSTASANSYYQVQNPVNGNSITVYYSASIVNSNGQTVATSKDVAVTWKSVPPTIHITANPQTGIMPGQPSMVSYVVSGDMGQGDTVTVTGVGNAANPWNTVSGSYAETYREIENPSAGQTIGETYTADIKDSSGNVISTSSVTVTWVNPWTGTISLSANPLHLAVQHPTTLTVSTSQPIPSGYTLYIEDVTTGQMVDSTTSTPFSTQYTSYSAATDTFVAYLSDGYEQIGSNSNQVTVQWSQLSLAANPEQLPAGQSSVLTVSGQNVPSGYYLVIYNENTGQEVGYSQNTPYSVSVSESNPQTDTYVAYISSNSNSSGSFATSNTTNVTWYTVQLSAVPLRLPVGQGTLLTASADNLPSGYVLDIVDQSNGVVLVSGKPGETTVSYTDTKNTPQTDTYIAQVVQPSNPAIPGLSVPATLPAQGIAVIEDVPGAGTASTANWTMTTNPGNYIAVMNSSGQWANLNMANSVDSALINQPFLYDDAHDRLVGFTQPAGQWGNWGDARFPSFNPGTEQWTDIDTGSSDTNTASYNTGVYNPTDGLIYEAGANYTNLMTLNPSTGAMTQLGAYTSIGGYNRYTHKPWYISYNDFSWISLDVKDQIILAAATSEQAYWAPDLFEYNIKTQQWTYLTQAPGWGMSPAVWDSQNDTFYFSVDTGYGTFSQNLYAWNPSTGFTTYNEPPGWVGFSWTMQYNPANGQLIMESSGYPSYEYNPQTQTYTQISGPVVNNMTYIEPFNELVGSVGNQLYAFNPSTRSWNLIGTGPTSNATIGGISYINSSNVQVSANNYFPFWTFAQMPSYVPQNLFPSMAQTSSENTSAIWTTGASSPSNGTAFFQATFTLPQTETVNFNNFWVDDYGQVYIDGKPLMQVGNGAGYVGGGIPNTTGMSITLSKGEHQVIIEASNNAGFVNPAPNPAAAHLVVTANGQTLLTTANPWQWTTTGYVTQLPSGWFSGAVGTYNFSEYVLGEQGTVVTQQASYTVQTTAQNVALQSQPVSVTWYQYGLTLTANPTSLLVNANTTLSATAPLGSPGTSVIQIWDTTTNQMVGQSSAAATTFTTTATRSTPGTDSFVSKLIDPSNGTLYAETDPVPVTWQSAPLSLSGAGVYHTANWLTNLNQYNTYYQAHDPSLVRSLSEFWAGEELVFRVKPSISTIQQAFVTLSGLQFSSFAPANPPVNLTGSFMIPLTYDTATGYLQGSTDPTWATWFQYLQDGTYTVQFFVKSQDAQVATTTASFTINAPWVSGNDPRSYDHETQVY